MKVPALAIAATAVGFFQPAVARLLGDNTDPANSAIFTSKSLEEALSKPRPSPQVVLASMGSGYASPEAAQPELAMGSSGSAVTDWLAEFIESIKSWAGSELMSAASKIVDTLGDKVEGADMYFNFIPRHVATLEHDGQWHNYKGRCFENIKVRSTRQSDGSFLLEADYRDAKSWTCAEYVLYGNSADFHMQYKFVRGTETYKWKADSGKVYVFDLSTSLANAAKGIVKTADFLLGRDVFEFLEHFNRLTFPKRASPGTSEISKENVHPGDAVLVTNLQGQSAAIMWGSGSASSHSLIFLREPETQELYAVESWAGGVRRLTFEEFLKDDAGWYNNAVLVPLKEEERAKFDNDAAWKKFVTDFEGNDYGFGNFLFGWLDTLDGNFPCLPMDGYQTCLTWEFAELLFGLVERVKPDMAQLLFLEAFNHRLDTANLGLSDIVKVADSKLEGGAGMILAIPENDEWTYHFNRNGKPTVGPSRVCSALVCEMLRAGGIFGDHEVSCTEFTPWDIYSMDIFTTPTYQLKGQKSITDHMAETCRTEITADSYYNRAPHC
ncbi:hypothetical protein FOL47_008934 [Perkinsus chesapeaki]|uniref:Uncharacterized protein n=1 Tax=Perkinsus chesapeaki TaxID=330153 RepID=A0A7J6N1T1_PERCH|nr:hypothetical protein FOL47_008934 [Perkinsus chesapeaki]